MAWNTIYADSSAETAAFSAAAFARYRAAAVERRKGAGQSATAIGSLRPCRISTTSASTHIDGSALSTNEIAINAADGCYYRWSGTAWAIEGSGASATASTYTAVSGVDNDYASGDCASGIVALLAFVYATPLTGAYGAGGTSPFTNYGDPSITVHGLADIATFTLTDLTGWIAAALLPDESPAGYTGAYPVRSYPQSITTTADTTFADGVACANGDVVVFNGVYYIFNSAASQWTIAGSGASGITTRGSVKAIPLAGDCSAAVLFNQGRDMLNTLYELEWSGTPGVSGDVNNETTGAAYGAATYGAAETAAAADYIHVIGNSSDAQKYAQIERVNSASWNGELLSRTRTYDFTDIPTFAASRVDGYVLASAMGFGTTSFFNDNSDLVLENLWSRFSIGAVASTATRTSSVLGSATQPIWPTAAHITALTDGQQTVAGWMLSNSAAVVVWRVAGGFAYTFDTP